jgi:hypothetical protein
LIFAEKGRTESGTENDLKILWSGGVEYRPNEDETGSLTFEVTSRIHSENEIIPQNWYEN